MCIRDSIQSAPEMDTYSWLVREDIQKNHILTLNRVLEAEKGLHHFADIFNNDSK